MPFFRTIPAQPASQDFFCLRHCLTDAGKDAHNQIKQDIIAGFNRITFFKDIQSVTDFLRILRADGLQFGGDLYHEFGGHYRGTALPVYLVRLTVNSSAVLAEPAEKTKQDLASGSLSVLRASGYTGQLVNLSVAGSADLNTELKIQETLLMGASVILQLADPGKLNITANLQHSRL